MKRLLPFLLSVCFFTLYLSFLSKAYVFEGLARALPIDTGHFNHLFAGNYLLYGILGQGFHTLLLLLGAKNPAYISLQILDAVYGACGLGIFYLSLKRLNANSITALLWSCVLGVTLGYWLWSTDAEDYIFSTLLLQFLFLGLLSEIQAMKASPVRLGLLHGLACLGHIVNGVMIIPCLWVLLQRKTQRGKIVSAYVGTLASLVGGAYAFTILFIKHLQSPHEMLIWFLGSAANNQGSPLRWHGLLQLSGIAQWLKMTLHILVANPTAYTHPAPLPGSLFFIFFARLMIFGLACVWVWNFRTIRQRFRAETNVCLLWLLSYALIFTSWEPGTMVYRVSDLIPIVTLLFLAGQSLSGSKVAAGMFVLIGWANFSAEIYPRSFPTNNAAWMHMQLIKSVTAEKDWVAVEGGTDELYVPYFAQRRPFLVNRFQQMPEKLTEELNALNAQGDRLFITSRLLNDPQWNLFFQHWMLQETARDNEGYVVYRVVRPAPTAAAIE